MITEQDKLDSGKIESRGASLRSLASSHPRLAKQIRTEANNFQTNAGRMRHPQFRRQKLFVGSGVIEAAKPSIIGTRLKQSGMFSTVRGANAIIALRCCQLRKVRGLLGIPSRLIHLCLCREPTTIPRAKALRTKAQCFTHRAYELDVLACFAKRASPVRAANESAPGQGRVCSKIHPPVGCNQPGR
jgi:hypothetical protein